MELRSPDTPTVLLVDDSPPYLVSMGELLEREGYTVLIARSGEAAVEMFRQTPIDIILIDRVMPGMGGVAAVRQMRQWASPQQVPIIMVTASLNDEDLRQASTAGVDNFLLKPVGAVQMQVTLKAALRLVRAGQSRVALLDRLPLAVLEFTVNGRLLRVNAASEALFGISQPTAVGRMVADVLFPPGCTALDDTTRAVRQAFRQQAFTQHLRGETPLHLRLEHAGERYLSLKMLENPLPEGRQFVAIIEDVTERELARRRLEDSEAQLRQILEQLPIPIMVSDSLGPRPIRLLNQRFTAIFGYAADDLPSVTEWAKSCCLNSAQQAGREVPPCCESALTAPGPREWQSPLECRVICRDGSCRDVLISRVQVNTYAVTSFVDITDRKQMEHALQVSEATLRRAQAVAQTGSWFLDCTSNRLAWSDETYRIFGLETGTPVDFETFLASVHADDRQPVIEAWNAALAGAPYDLEHRLAGCADRWVRERAEILFAPHGPPLTALGTVQDISERVKAENALKESYLLLQAILEALPIRVFWKDREGHYLGCNTAFAQDAGVTGPADLVGKDDFQLGWRDQAELYRADDFAVMASGLSKPPYEEPQTTPEGQIIWIRTAKVPLRDSQGDIFGILGIYEDVSPERHMREALRTSQERLALALQGANDGLWDLNLATGTTYYSPRWLEMLGYREGELPTTQAAWQRLVHPDDLPRVEAALAAYLEKRIGRYEVELRMRHREGHWVSILSRAILARDEQGHYIQPQRLVGTHVDISERKRFEHDLETARSAAESANVAKSQFLANMSHEIRTPLNAILGLTQILQRETQDAGHHEVLGKIGEAGNSLLHIINDILDFSKIEAGQLRIAPHPFELGALLTRLESLFTPTAHQKGITLSIRGPAGVGDMLDGDATRLEQVLINLIGNAIKFTETGKVTVRVNALAVDRRQARLRFTVADTGIGIAPEALANLFQPFTQAEAGITRRFGGTGLGLSISKHLVELMGGTIGVDSTLGQGSTFWFELTWPRVARDAPNPPAPAIQPELRGPRLQGLRVLAVDDNHINLFMLERALQLEGAQVHLAADGQQALQTLAASPHGFDVVLMDIQMPVMDGLTATRAIRQNPELAALPVIALTAGVLAEERAAAEAAGMTDFLPKPLELERMVVVLQPLMAGGGGSH